MSRKNIRKMMRSGTQACPICSREVPLVEHHINGRGVPHWNDPWNIVSICATCHDMVHMNKLSNRIIIEGWFKTTSGRELLWHHAGEESITGEESEPPVY